MSTGGAGVGRRAAALVSHSSTPWLNGELGLLVAADSATRPLASKSHADEAGSLRLLSYNIRHGKGLDGEIDLERIAELILEFAPDVVALQEVDRGVARTGGVDQAAELARLTGFDAFFAKFMDYRGGEYGMAILTRLPIIEAKRVVLPWDVEPRSSAVVTMQTDAGPVTVANIHFYKTTGQRLAQAKALQEALDGVTHPVVWIGDFNSYRGDEVMSWLERRYAQPVKDGHPDTFPADQPSREIDFIIFTPAEAFQALAHEVVNEPVISDHRPVLAVLIRAH